MSVVHLHTHTRFSLLDGLAHERQLAEKAASDGQPALAITDHGNMHGVIQFIKACHAAGIQPIIGCELYVVPGDGSRFDRGGAQEEGADRGPATHLTVLAKNEEGYRNLLKLTSKGYEEGFYYKPRVDKELLQKHAAGLITTSGCPMSEISRLILADKIDEAEKLCLWYRDLFGADSFFLEVQDHGLEMEKTIQAGLMEIHRRTKIPFLATNDVHYVDAQDAEAHDVLLCIQTGRKLDDPSRMKMSDNEGNLIAKWHLMTAREMEELFGRYPGAVENTLRVAEQVKFMPVVRGYHPDFKYLLPEYPDLKPGETPLDCLRRLTYEGARRRYGDPIPADRREQIEKELKIISEAGFENYFLIVQDIVTHARDSGIPVGHGRGSGVGSEVAYCLRITNIPPAEFDLVFERFLHLHRVSMPDIDVDIADDRREEVAAFIRNRYGESAVAQIATFGTLAARSAVRDVARVMGVDLGKADKIAKAIPTAIEAKGVLERHEAALIAKGITVPKGNINIPVALEIAPDLRKMYESDPETKRVLDLAALIEGVPRHASRHAGGFIVAPGDLTQYAPVFVSKGARAVQVDYEDAEDIGLLKLDFLGLRTLRIVHETLRLIKAHSGREIDLEKIPLDDRKTYELLWRGDCAGVFQFEGTGMRNLMREMRPNSIEDLVAAVSLFRPGPMVNIPTYIARKHGVEPVSYPHEDLESILKTTYGIIVYQEQVLQIAAKIAGFDLGKADMLRRAMGKKQPEEMARLRAEFVDGAVSRGYDRKMASSLFAEIERFASYAFNKAHAVPYARLAYETAYLKAHYPAAFYAALLSSESGNQDKIAEYLAEARREGIKVLPPDINRSNEDFDVVDDKTVIYGLGGIRDVGASAKGIVEERRKGGGYASILDLALRTKINKKVLEALVRSGACDALGKDRGELLQALEDTSALARDIASKAGPGQRLIDDLPFMQALLQKDQGQEESLHIEDRLADELRYLGAYVSQHPLSLYKVLMDNTGCCTYQDLVRAEDRSVIVCGLVSSVDKLVTRNGQNMAVTKIDLDDQHTMDLLIIRPYAEVVDSLEVGRVLLAHGNVIKEVVSTDDDDDQIEEQQFVLKMFPDRVHVLPSIRDLKSIVYVKLPQGVTSQVRDIIQRHTQDERKLRTIPIVLITNGRRRMVFAAPGKVRALVGALKGMGAKAKLKKLTA